MHHTGDRLILTTRGREETREKIQREKKQVREAWGFYLQLIITIGSLLVAALAIYFRKRSLAFAIARRWIAPHRLSRPHRSRKDVDLSAVWIIASPYRLLTTGL